MSTDTKDTKLGENSERDASGRFTQGNTCSIGNKGGSRISRARQLEREAEAHPDRTQELMDQCYLMATTSKDDRLRLEAMKYYIDRLKGRPHQSQDIRVKAVPAFTAEDYEDLDRLTELRRQEELILLEESNDVD